MGRFDLPAQIDYVLQTTNFKQVFCFGHSMGTAIFFVMASTRPEYNLKVKAFFSAGTSIYLEHMTSALRVPLTAFYLLRVIKEVNHFDCLYLCARQRLELYINMLFIFCKKK